MGYKSTLRSSLIALNYEEKFETLYDLAQSGIPLVVAKGTFIQRILSTDPRPTVKRLNKNAYFFRYEGGQAPKRLKDM